MKIKNIIVLMAIGLVFLYGCTQTTNTGVMEKETVMEKESTHKNIDVETEKENLQITSLANNYYRYDKAHYEKSLKEGKIIFLDFHADWCPICRQEQPHIFNAFNEINDPNVVGYQVHYNDGKTIADDKDLAKYFGITYQHTKVILNSNGKVALKSLEVFSKEKVLEEINKVVGE